MNTYNIRVSVPPWALKKWWLVAYKIPAVGWAV